MPIGESTCGHIDILTELCDTYTNVQLGFVLGTNRGQLANCNARNSIYQCECSRRLTFDHLRNVRGDV